jgi:hypothetical protein
MFINSSRGKWVFPALLWSFPPSSTLTSFPTPGCWGHAPLLPEALRPAWFVYLQSQEGFPSPNLQRSGRPTLFPVCLNCSYCLLLSFSFFPWWRSVCPGGYAALAQACLRGYRSTAKLTWSASSQAVWAPAAPGALLVSPFNVKWRFSAPALAAILESRSSKPFHKHVSPPVVAVTRRQAVWVWIHTCSGNSYHSHTQIYNSILVVRSLISILVPYLPGESIN